jgi:hypothetical protein
MGNHSKRKKTWGEIGNPAGGAVFGGWRRCSSVANQNNMVRRSLREGVRCGYPPSSRLASRQNRLPQSHFDFEDKP